MTHSVFFCGNMMAGKSSASAYLAQLGFRVCSLAAPLKILEAIPKEASFRLDYLRLLNVAYARGGGEKSEEYVLNVQKRLLKTLDTIARDEEKPVLRYQFLGESFRQEIGEDYWVRLLFAQTRHRDPNALFVCDDVRYTNEVRLLRNAGWLGVALSVSSGMQEERAKLLKREHALKLRGHASEQDVQLIIQSGVIPVVDADVPLDAMLTKIEEVLSE